MKFKLAPIALSLSLCATPALAATMDDLDSAISRQQWTEAAETANEILTQNPRESAAKLKGAYVLFKKGCPTAGLLFLQGLSEREWKSLPQGQDRLAEIVLLFQKKVPLSLLPGRLEQLKVSENSSYLQNEILFAKGRDA